jgi:hypothetical protein
MYFCFLGSFSIWLGIPFCYFLFASSWFLLLRRLRVLWFLLVCYRSWLKLCRRLIREVQCERLDRALLSVVGPVCSCFLRFSVIFCMAWYTCSWVFLIVVLLRCFLWRGKLYLPPRRMVFLSFLDRSSILFGFWRIWVPFLYLCEVSWGLYSWWWLLD